MYLGADPEFFLFDKLLGKIVPASAAGLRNGKHDKAMRLQTDYGIEAYRDGYGVEVNFVKKHFCRGLMGNAFRSGVSQMYKGWGGKYSFQTIPTIPVDLKEIQELPADIAQFGCAPSENAWGEKLDISKVDGLEHPWRYIGGHLWMSNSLDECPWLGQKEGIEKFVRALDYYLGVPFTYIFQRPEAFQRRKMYGRAGDYRTRDFGAAMIGLEYRTLSPEWFNNPAWFSFVLGVARFLSTRFSFIDHDAIRERGPRIRMAINEGIDLEDMLPPRLFGFYTKEGLQACREVPGKFDFTFPVCGDAHLGWDSWTTDQQIPGDWNAGDSTNMQVGR